MKFLGFSDAGMEIANHSKDLMIQYNNLLSGHFFDKDTMRFFASRLTNLDKKVSPTELYFVTSEKSGFDDPTRQFNLRKAELVFTTDTEGYKYAEIRIDTIEKFSSRSQAARALKELKIKGGSP